MHLYFLHLYVQPDNGGTIPSENLPFTTHVDPNSPPQLNLLNGGGAGFRPRVHNAYSERRLSL